MTKRVEVEVERGDGVITVEIEYTPGGRAYMDDGAWHPGDPSEVDFVSAVDEDGNPVRLTDEERQAADRLAAEKGDENDRD